jgi:hypothetical protein
MLSDIITGFWLDPSQTAVDRQCVVVQARSGRTVKSACRPGLPAGQDTAVMQAPEDWSTVAEDDVHAVSTGEA